ncbi:unnamed protein product [Urochloa humidicola]
MRRRSGSRALLVVLWLAYLSADTVAIFVLGHLAVYVRGPSHELMFFWAPFVLVHLGGQDNITAFSKQDNELWMRHLLSLVSQVVVAGYVVSKSSWPDVRLRAAMVLMFLYGVLKYAGRTYCLCSANPKNLGVSSLLRLSMTVQGLQELQEQPNSTRDDRCRGHVVRAASLFLFTGRFGMMFVRDKCWEYSSQLLYPEADEDGILLADAPVNDVSAIVAADRLPDLLEKFKNSPDRCMAYQFVAESLVKSYKYLYTKTPLSLNADMYTIFDRGLSGLFYLIHALFQYLPTAIALVLFAAAEKKSHYSHADIIVSYLLLEGAIVLDLLPAFTSIVSYTRKPFRPRTAADWAKMCLINCFVRPLGWQTTKKLWSEELAQYSMIRRYACVPGPSLQKWASKGFFGAWGVDFFDLTRTPVTGDLMLLVLDKLLLQASKQEWDIASFRGERALEEWTGSYQVPESSGYAALHRSVSSSRVDFPTGVLIWHIATDICYFSEDNKDIDHIDPDEMKKKTTMSRELSLYIMYLVFKCNVRLTSISRLAHMKAHEELMEFIPSRRHHQSPQVNLDEKEVVKKVFEATMKQADPQQGSPAVAHQDKSNEESDNSGPGGTSADVRQDIIRRLEKMRMMRMEEHLRSTEEALYSPVLPRAHAVAQELMSINDRWDLILEVWLEMLFYTAPRCGGAFHYEHLSTGGEFITHVLLLMRNLGPFMPKPGA